MIDIHLHVTNISISEQFDLGKFMWNTGFAHRRLEKRFAMFAPVLN